MKHLFCILMALILLITLAACGGEKKSAAETDRPQSAPQASADQNLLSYDGPYQLGGCELRLTGTWLVPDSFGDTQFVLGFELENRSQEKHTPYWTVSSILSQDGRTLNSYADLSLPDASGSTLMDYSMIEVLPGGNCPFYVHSTLADLKKPVHVRLSDMFNDDDSYEFDVAIEELAPVELSAMDLPPMEAVGGAEIVETHEPIELSGETAVFNYYDKLTLTYPSDFLAEDPDSFLYNLVSVDASVKLGVYATDSADNAQAKRDEWAGYAEASTEYTVSEMTVAGYPALVYTYYEPFTGYNAKLLLDLNGDGGLYGVNFDVCTSTQDLLLGDLVMNVLNSLTLTAG